MSSIAIEGAQCSTIDLIYALSSTSSQSVSIGANSSIIGHQTIGKWSIVGMGSVLIKEVNDFEIVPGNPARVIGMNQAADHLFNI